MIEHQLLLQTCMMWWLQPQRIMLQDYVAKQAIGVHSTGFAEAFVTVVAHINVVSVLPSVKASLDCAVRSRRSFMKYGYIMAASKSEADMRAC